MWRTFEVFDARTVEEALFHLSRYGKEARLIAGGTDLLRDSGDDKVDARYLINVLSISGLDRIETDPQGSLRLGALTTIQSIVDSRVIKERNPVLSEAATQLGSLQVRNVATLGGNLCNASPAAEMAPPLMVLGAKVTSVGKKGQKVHLIENFFEGPSKTVLSDDEMLIRVEVPPSPDRSAAVYLKFGPRRAMDIALAGVAAFVKLDSERPRFCEARIALGAVAPTPFRARRAEESLRGEEVKESIIQRASLLASQEASPISDLRGSASYRREIVRALTRRGIQLALKRMDASLSQQTS